MKGAVSKRPCHCDRGVLVPRRTRQADGDLLQIRAALDSTYRDSSWPTWEDWEGGLLWIGEPRSVHVKQGVPCKGVA